MRKLATLSLPQFKESPADLFSLLEEDEYIEIAFVSENELFVIINQVKPFDLEEALSWAPVEEEK